MFLTFKFLTIYSLIYTVHILYINLFTYLLNIYCTHLYKLVNIRK